MLPGYIMLIIREGFVACYGHDLNLGHLLLEGLETGHFFDAGSTPAGPEIEHDYFALKTLQIDGVLAVIDGKYRGLSANLVGKGASITAGGDGAGKENQKSRTHDLPHKVFILAYVPIIRSCERRS